MTVEQWSALAGFAATIGVIAWARWRILSTKFDIDLDNLHADIHAARACKHPAHRSGVDGACHACALDEEIRNLGRRGAA